jgi:hypothetical protein
MTKSMANDFLLAAGFACDKDQRGIASLNLA